MPAIPNRDQGENAPLYLILDGGKSTPLPSKHYIRVVAQHMGPDQKIVRCDFALHNRGARLCRLLGSFLDALDLDVESKVNLVDGPIPPVVIPQATREGCESVFRYLDLIQTRIPYLLGKPLRAPLEELIHEWEMDYLLTECLGSKEGDSARTSVELSKAMAKQGPSSMDRIIEIAMIADFLLIEPLRDLVCACMASIGLTAGSERELLQLCGLSRPLTEEELEPLYLQMPFLRPEEDAKLSD